MKIRFNLNELRVKTSILTLIFVFVSSLTKSMTNDMSPNAKASGDISLYDKSFNNPVSITKLNNPFLSISYWNDYFTRELGTGNLTIACPLRHLNLATNVSFYGFEEYNNINLRICTNRQFCELFSMGLKGEYTSHKHAGLENRKNGFSVVSSVKFDKNWKKEFTFAVSAGISHQTFGISEKETEFIGNFAIQMKVSTDFDWTAEFNRDQRGRNEGRLGVSVGIPTKQSIRIRGGITAPDTSASTGFSVKTGVIEIDYGVKIRNRLGVCMGLGITVELGKKWR